MQGISSTPSFMFFLFLSNFSIASHQNIEILSLCSYFFLVMIATTEPTIVFPPNLEDGEQWLPKHVFHEINTTVFATSRPSVSNTSNPMTQSHQWLPDAIAPPSFSTIVSTETKGKLPVYDPCQSAKPLIPTACCSHRNYGFQAVPGLFRTKYSSRPPQCQGFRDVRALFPSGKREGTGVFLPQVVNQSSRACAENIGTEAVFKNQVTFKNKKANRNSRSKKIHANEDASTTNEEPKKPHDGIDGVCLPPKWIY